MAIGANINMIKVSCSFCGRKPYNEKFDSDFWPLYTRNIDLYSNVSICNACKIRHPDAFDFYFSEKEEEPMKVKVKRDSKEEIEVDVNDLQYNDEFDISKGGEVIATATVTDTWEFNGACRADVTITFKKEGKTWKDLGYNSFEDMIDDIAKEHGSTGHKYAGEWVDEIYPGTFDGHLIADSYRDCIISIYDAKTDKHAIINAPCATVYIPDKAKCFNNSFEDMIKEGRITSPSNYIKIHDAAHEGKKYVYADSFGKSIVRVINDDGSSTIYDADQFQVYLEEEDD